MDHVALAEAAGEKGARHAPIVVAVAVGLVDGSRRLIDIANPPRRHGGKTSQRRRLFLHLDEIALARHGQPGQGLAAGNGVGVDPLEEPAEVGGVFLGVGNLRGKRLEERRFPFFRRTGLLFVVMLL